MNILQKIQEPWIQTFTGQKFRIDDPKQETINIEDIAHALSMICRYAGHSKFFYSVAQHCYLASFLCPDHLRLAVLLHDAAEAYLGDVTKPLKYYFGGKYIHMEVKIQNAINFKYGVSLTEQDILKIKMADLQMLKLEAQNVLANNPVDNWHKNLPDQDAFKTIEQGWVPEYAKVSFLDRFLNLYQQSVVRN